MTKSIPVETDSSPLLQLSQKYKSSADLVSELLKKPVFTRYRSIKKKPGWGVQKASDLHSKLAVISSEAECPPLESVDLVRNINTVSRQEEEVNMPRVERVEIKSPVTLKPRLETVSSGLEQTDSHSEAPADDEVTKCQTNTTNRTNQSDTPTTVSTAPADMSISLRISSLANPSIRQSVRLSHTNHLGHLRLINNLENI